MDPVTGGLVLAAIQIAAEYARKAGMTREQAAAHFLSQYDLAKTNDPDKLPDAEVPPKVG
jgi:hypothetical protein